MKIFFDNCLPPVEAKAFALVLPQHDVRHLADMFPRNTPDTVWIPALGEQGGWIVITRDPGIRRKPHERRVWKESRVTVFFLANGWGNLDLFRLHARLWEAMPTIIRHAMDAHAGTGFVVSVNGKVSRLP